MLLTIGSKFGKWTVKQPDGMVEPFTQKPEKEMVDISAPIVR